MLVIKFTLCKEEKGEICNKLQKHGVEALQINLYCRYVEKPILQSSGASLRVLFARQSK